MNSLFGGNHQQQNNSLFSNPGNNMFNQQNTNHQLNNANSLFGNTNQNTNNLFNYNANNITRENNLFSNIPNFLSVKNFSKILFNFFSNFELFLNFNEL